MARLPEPFDARIAKPWSVRRRLEFIELRLLWEGTVNRSDLVEKFGISPQQATVDLADYQSLAPGNCEYDGSAKTYVAGESFKSLFGRGNSEFYLNELRAIAEGSTADRFNSWIGTIPHCAVPPIPWRQVTPAILRSVLRAIETKEALLISYQSETKREPTPCWITPHALGFDGYRWHARAFDHREREFSDFKLTRILKIRESNSHEVDPELDREWIGQVGLIFKAHPELPRVARTAVEIDHNMRGGKLQISVRGALVRSFVRWMRADSKESAGPGDPGIVLANTEYVDERLEALRVESIDRIREKMI